MPPALQTAYNTRVTDFPEADRGVVRRSNDRTFDTRAGNFASWLSTAGYDLNSVRLIHSNNFAAILASYTAALKDGDNLQKLPAIADQTIRGYLDSASTYLAMLTGQQCS